MSKSQHITSTERREIPGAPGYAADCFGRIWTLRRRGGPDWRLTNEWREMKSHRHGRLGHRRLNLMIDGRQQPRLVHRLILETFVGPCPEGMECRHLDGDPANNHLENLAWGTKQENAADSVRHGTFHAVPCHGKLNVTAKLTESDVLEIRRLHASGVTCAAIARTYGVTYQNIKQIAERRIWKNVGS